MHLTALLFCVAAFVLSQTISAAGLLPKDSRQQIITYSSSTTTDSNSDSLKVPGASPAYYCSDPSSDLFQISRLDFSPTHPRIGYYFSIRLYGTFMSATGDVPWLNITGTINGHEELEPFYYAPLCDIDVYQKISVPRPDHKPVDLEGLHRSCPPAIQSGYAQIWSPPMPLYSFAVHEGTYVVRAEATTQDGRQIFCVKGSFNITR